MFTGLRRSSSGSSIKKGKARADADKADKAEPAWLGKGTHDYQQEQARMTKKSGKQQLQLVFAGECGSGIATLRRSASSSLPQAGPSTSQASSRQSSSSRTRAGKSDGTLKQWMRPKSQAAVSSHAASTSNTRSRADTRSGRTDTRTDSFLSEAIDGRAPRKGAKRASASAQTDDEDDASTEPDVAGEPNLRSDLSEACPISPMQDVSATNITALPPMPKPLPSISCSDPGIFGFGALPRPLSPKASGTSQPKPKKQRLMIVESSSPVKEACIEARVLVPPSTPSVYATADLATSPLSPLRSSPPQRQGSSNTRNALTRQYGQRPTQNPRSPSRSQPRKGERPGTRIAWDSQDTVEERRLNRSPSTHSLELARINRQVALNRLRPRTPEALRRPPRCPPSAHFSQDRTSYMDAFRDEEYSQFEHTMPPDMQQEVLKRLGLGNKDVAEQREKRRRQWDAEMLEVKRRKQSAMRLHEEREGAEKEGAEKEGAEKEGAEREGAEKKGAEKESAVEESAPFPPGEEYVDESATEYTLPSQSRIKCATNEPSLAQKQTPPRHPDDSGFVDAVEDPLRLPGNAALVDDLDDQQSSNDSVYTLAPDSEAFLELVPSSQEGEGNALIPDIIEQSFMPRMRHSSLRQSIRLPLSERRDYTSNHHRTTCDESIPDSEDEDEATSRELLDLNDDNEDETQDSELIVQQSLVPLRAGRRESRILAQDTQDVMEVETQGILAVETMPYAERSLLSRVAEKAENMDSDDDFEISIPCSQGSGNEENAEHAGKLLEHDTPIRRVALSPYSEAISTANVIISRKRKEPQTSETSATRNVGGIEDSITSAWFDSVFLPPQTSTSVSYEGVQASLGKYFEIRPGEKEERKRKETQRTFVDAVKAMKAYNPAAARPAAMHDGPARAESQRTEEIDAAQNSDQVVPSSQTQADLEHLDCDSLAFDAEHDATDIIPDSQTTGVRRKADPGHAIEDIDLEAAEVSRMSCEAWVQGRSDEAPSPVKRIRRARARRNV